MARSSYIYMAIHPVDGEGPPAVPVRACTVKWEFISWLEGVSEEARDILTFYRLQDNGDRLTLLDWRELLA